MLGTIFVIWLILVVIGGIAKGIENGRKRQAILDYQYSQAVKERKRGIPND